MKQYVVRPNLLWPWKLPECCQCHHHGTSSRHQTPPPGTYQHPVDTADTRWQMGSLSPHCASYLYYLVRSLVPVDIFITMRGECCHVNTANHHSSVPVVIWCKSSLRHRSCWLQMLVPVIILSSTVSKLSAVSLASDATLVPTCHSSTPDIATSIHIISYFYCMYRSDSTDISSYL